MNQNIKKTGFLELSDNLEEWQEGHWIAKGVQPEVSYPESHHALLLEEQQSSFWYDHRKKCLEIILDKFPCDSLLDVGGSNGLLASHLSKSTCVQVLEPHAIGIQNALSLGLKPVIQADFRTAGFKDNSIPAIGLFDVLEHIEEDQLFLKEIERTLQPGGLLYMTVPAYNFLWSDFDTQVGHFRRYNRKTVTQNLKSAGFQLEYFTYMFAPLPVPIWFKRVLGGKRQATKTTATHYRNKGLMGKLLKTLLSPEYGMIKNQVRIPWGSSCLCVAKKVSRT